jgi:hypothetical protein
MEVHDEAYRNEDGPRIDAGPEDRVPIGDRNTRK